MASTWTNLIGNVKREKLLSISNVLIMTITYLLLGVLIYVVALSQTAIRYLERQAQVTVFFEDTFAEPEIFGLRNKLQGDERILEVKYISKDDALKLFTEINKDEPILLESITKDVLPASLEIKTVDVADLSVMANELSGMQGVEDVRFFENVVSKFIFWSNVVYIVGMVLVVLFLLISYSIILVTLRTTINSKGVELEIMKLVGATDSYVKAPLIYQGVFFGVISALIAGTISILLGGAAGKWASLANGLSFAFLPQLTLSTTAFSFVLFGILLFSGAILGYLGSYTAVKRYLKY